MKKLIIISLSLALIMTLGGCNSKKNGAEVIETPVEVEVVEETKTPEVEVESEKKKTPEVTVEELDDDTNIVTEDNQPAFRVEWADDVLSEIPDYYDRLKKMEDEAGIVEGQGFYPQPQYKKPESFREKLIMSIDLTNLFYLKVASINKSIDKEMVKRKYYKESPEDVRNKYIGIGAAGAFISGGVLFFGFAFLLIIPGLFITVISIFLLSIGLSIVGNYMPAKTKEGAKILNRIKGFRMYLYTAERFRVQDLTPETFEKFLPYAMVFGIEKQWGERFKDIYKKAPDWYETSSWNTFNTIYMINSLSNFSTYSSRTLSSRPQSSSSGGSRGGSIGGGWSGGGGFSGSFSGGGGGGGSSGWG